MALAGNGIFVIRGEIATLMTAMRRTTRWSSHSYQEDDQDPLMKSFQELKDSLNKLDDLKHLEPLVFLSPFLDTIKSEDTTGPVTSLSLSAVNKFLCYGLIDHTQPYVSLTVHSIADAISHARFISSDLSSDSVVLLKILQVLRTLTLAPEGIYLTNESLCEIMLSCFKICFEAKLHELLRRTAEHYLKDIVQLVFMRLPQFSDSLQEHSKQLKMRAGSLESTRNSGRRKNRSSIRQKTKLETPKALGVENKTADEITSKPSVPVTVPISENENNIVDMQGSISQICSIPITNATTPTTEHPTSNDLTTMHPPSATYNESSRPTLDQQLTLEQHPEPRTPSSTTTESSSLEPKPTVADYVNPRGIRFVAQSTGHRPGDPQQQQTLHPYGIACVRELLRFLVSLCNPHDRQNTEPMISLGLTLLTVAFEVGADSIGRYETLMGLVKDEMCRCLFALLTTERLTIFSSTQQVCLLLFESQRLHLKFQLQHYLCRLLEIVAPDSVNSTATVSVSANSSTAMASAGSSSTGSGGTAGLKVSYEHREIALDTILHLWRIPGFVTELYLNYDCHMYCPNLFEELGKLLAKNAFPAAQGVFGTHLLSLDALLSVVEEMGQRCHTTNGQHRDVRMEGQGDDKEDQSLVGLTLSRQISEQVPSRNELIAVKNIKRWLPTGTEYFNQKAKKGIQFLQEHAVLETPLNPQEIVHFLRENPDLDKKQIGDYISGRSNNQVLHAFVNMFDFAETRIDDALRMFLEAFRLPGEAPLISLLLETFAAHWHKSNGAPFANEDAAFTLAYAVIMLNVDQHNHNVKKQSQSMSAEAFKKNLTKVNGGSDFEQDLLDDIYTSIKNEEIVMPAEQTGPVRDNYLWKVLLRRGASGIEGRYVRVSSGTYDHDLFTLIWAPTVSALSHVLERAEEVTVWRKALHGFERCAHIAACYGNTSNVDTVIATLAKYTQLSHHHNTSTANGISPNSRPSSYNNPSNPQQLYNQLGGAPKAQLALRTMFTLVRQYGDSLREEGWRQLMDAVLALFAAEALPRVYCEAEDFIEPSGKVVLQYEHREVQKQDTGLLSSLYSYMVSSENIAKVPTLEEQELIDVAKVCIKDCNLEQVITDSKFLHVDALVALIKTLIELSKGPDVQKSLGYTYNESVTIFFLELLVKVVLQNRDRVMCVWQSVRDHLYMLPMNACLFDYPLLLQRSVVALLRLAVRLMRNEEMSGAVLQSLHMLLLLKTNILYRISKQIAYGLYELLKTSAQNIHTSKDWALVFTLLECIGAGAQPPRPITDDTQLEADTRSDGELDQMSSSPNSTLLQPHQTGSSGNLPGINSDGASSTLDLVDRGYTSDSELAKSPRHQQPQLLAQQHQQHSPVQLVQSVSINASTGPLMSPSTHNSGWILVGSEGEVQQVVGRTPPAAQYGLHLERTLGAHDPHALLKCCESLAFLVRDVAHITPYNFDDCVHCIRTFVEASLQANKKSKRTITVDGRQRRKTSGRRRNDIRSGHRSPTSSPDEDDESETEDEVPSGYHQVTIQLLDLMHTLHTRTAQIFKWWAEESTSEFDTAHKQMSLWTQGWCPLLQGIARLCCDTRKQIRMSAITYLQRALLVHDLQTLTGPEWEACFHRVLFPLLTQLLLPLGTSKDIISMEETRMRAATVLSKVFLHHLTPLLSLPTFASLWLIILEFMDKYMHADGSDLLAEAIPESMKNMLLVMESAGVFSQDPNLWPLTWQRIGRFLPHLKDELFQPPQQKGVEGAEGDVDETGGEKQQQVAEDVVPSVVQHNIEHATRSSIILQPPSSQHGMMNSTLFAHLGQMVSTPIGPPNPAPIIYPQPQYPKPPIPIPTPLSLPPHLLTTVNSIHSPLQQLKQSQPPLSTNPHRATSPINHSPVSPVRNLPMPSLPTQPLTTSLISSHPPLAPIVTPLPLTANLPPFPSSVTIAPPLPVHIPNATSIASPTMVPHTFPVLYAASPPAAPAIPVLLTQLPINNNVDRKQEGTGTSIYADYLDNPYNMAAIQSTCSVNNNGVSGGLSATETLTTVSSDLFQTSHYFGGNQPDNGSDLFHNCLGQQTANSIPCTYEAADVKNSN